VKKSLSVKTFLASIEVPHGLLIVPEFITSDHEVNLIEMIDAMPWDESMLRRVQHHGWRYDYKGRKVDEAAYLGPLPDWASSLGEKLADDGLVSEMPDQMLINEYIGAQGISKHIDCPSCFRGPVVTISLNESWEMTFSRADSSGSTERYKVVLPRRSATVLDGDARSHWLHEIPKRLKESGVARGRRVSITFRKVDNKKPK
jgi:alkylated DNA repair dioxygenase AlkB